MFHFNNEYKFLRPWKPLWNGLNFSYLFYNNIISTKHELRTQSYILVSNKENTSTNTACFSRTSIHVCITLGLDNNSFTSITHVILHSTHIVFEMMTSFYFLTYTIFIWKYPFSGSRDPNKWVFETVCLSVAIGYNPLILKNLIKFTSNMYFGSQH